MACTHTRILSPSANVCAGAAEPVWPAPMAVYEGLQELLQLQVTTLVTEHGVDPRLEVRRRTGRRRLLGGSSAQSRACLCPEARACTGGGARVVDAVPAQDRHAGPSAADRADRGDAQGGRQQPAQHGAAEDATPARTALFGARLTPHGDVPSPLAHRRRKPSNATWPRSPRSRAR